MDFVSNQSISISAPHQFWFKSAQPQQKSKRCCLGSRSEGLAYFLYIMPERRISFIHFASTPMSTSPLSFLNMNTLCLRRALLRCSFCPKVFRKEEVQ